MTSVRPMAPISRNRPTAIWCTRNMMHQKVKNLHGHICQMPGHAASDHARLSLVQVLECVTSAQHSHTVLAHSLLARDPSGRIM